MGPIILQSVQVHKADMHVLRGNMSGSGIESLGNFLSYPCGNWVSKNVGRKYSIVLNLFYKG